MRLLCVTTTSRGAAVAADTVGGMSWWLSEYDVLTAFVSRDGPSPSIFGDEVLRFDSRVSKNVPAGFAMAEAVGWAIETEEPFDYAVFVSDTCVFPTRMMQPVFEVLASRYDIGVCGVAETLRREFRYAQAFDSLCRFGLAAPPERPDTSLCDDVLILSRELCERMDAANLLVPAAVTGRSRQPAWPESYGAYVAWVAKAYYVRVLAWGTDQRPLPPLYVSEQPAPPMALRDQFSVFSSVRRVPGYSETDLREIIKAGQGRPAAYVEPFAPFVY